LIDELKLEEQFMLAVANAPKSNTLHLPRAYLQVYTIGAAMFEMLREGQFKLDAEEKFGVVPGAVTEPSRQPLLDVIATTESAKKMKFWMINFFYNSGKRNRVYEALVAPLYQSGLVRQEEYKFLWLFPRTRLIADARHKDRIIQGLRAELLEDGPVSTETATLAMLLDASRQLKNYFSDYERNEMQAHLKLLQTEKNADWHIIDQIRKAISEIESKKAAATAAGAPAGAH
jgi:hypothetical protein